MNFKGQKINPAHLKTHETKKHILFKFSLVVAVFVGYFLFLAREYGAADGAMLAALSWSFFVLCTPVADAGFLLDFPLRLILCVRMIFSEIIVWAVAISLNFYAFFFAPENYQKTELLKLFHHILATPIPFWAIILVSAVGTFFSIHFGDELMDKVRHRDRHFYETHKHNFRFIAMIFVFGISFVLYDFLLKKLGIEIPI